MKNNKLNGERYENEFALKRIAERESKLRKEALAKERRTEQFRLFFILFFCLGLLCLAIYFAYQILLGPLPHTVLHFFVMFLVFGWMVFTISWCWGNHFIKKSGGKSEYDQSDFFEIIVATVIAVVITTSVVAPASLSWSKYKEPCSIEVYFEPDREFWDVRRPDHCHSISSGFGELIVEIVPFVLPIGAIAKVGGIGRAAKSITRVGNTYK